MHITIDLLTECEVAVYQEAFRECSTTGDMEIPPRMLKPVIEQIKPGYNPLDAELQVHTSWPPAPRYTSGPVACPFLPVTAPDIDLCRASPSPRTRPFPENH